MSARARSIFRDFVSALGAAQLSANAFNQYSLMHAPVEANAIRRRNLTLYLEELLERRSSSILVGEAPSYRGGRLTGIPFVSESILLCGVPEARMFGPDRGYRKSPEFERVSTEASATIVWATIRNVEPLPLLWNAFPFHPFQSANPFSNRLPTRGELEIGRPFIRRLLDLFPIEQVIAVGNAADQSLEVMGVPHRKVRHPSLGGKVKFVQGLRELLVTA